MKKEVKREIDLNIDKDMQGILDRNYLEGRKQYLKALRKKRIKERVLAVIVGGFIMVATSLLLILNSKLMNDAKESCMSSGHSENYCMERL